MQILNFISEKIIHPVFGQDSLPSGWEGVVLCYETGPMTPEPPSTLNFFLFLVAPISAFFLNFITALNLRKRQFNTLNEIYKAFLKSLILIVVFYLIISIVEYFLGYYPIAFLTDYADSEKFLIFLAMALMAGGLAFMPFGIKNLKMLKIFLALILVFPSLFVFIFVLATKIIPSLRQYAPRDPAQIKKEALVTKIKKQGIIK